MQYANLGRSGLKVSRVSFGCWLTVGNVLDQATSDDLVRRAVDLGINLLDTADVYNMGEGEIALGRAIEGLKRESLVIASKCFFPMSDEVNDRGLSRKHIVESVHASLRRLGTDYLDLYQCHRPDPETPVEETAMAMNDLIRQGKVLYWGVSYWPARLIVQAVQFCRSHGFHAPISNQPPYNPAQPRTRDRSARRGGGRGCDADRVLAAGPGGVERQVSAGQAGHLRHPGGRQPRESLHRSLQHARAARAKRSSWSRSRRRSGRARVRWRSRGVCGGRRSPA